MSGKLRILIVDDNLSMAKTIRDILIAKGYAAESVYSGSGALEKVAEIHFDCVLTDIKMPEMNGVELCIAIKDLQPDIPVVLMTAYSTDELVRKGIEEGAIATLTKPLDIDALLRFISMLDKERSVVIVDNDAQFCKTLGDILIGRGFAVIQVVDPHDAVEEIEHALQVVLLDMKLDNISGLDILKDIRKIYPHQPVILVTGYREGMSSMIEECMKIRAYACLYKPLQIDDLIEVIREITHKELGRVLGQPTM